MPTSARGHGILMSGTDLDTSPDTPLGRHEPKSKSCIIRPNYGEPSPPDFSDGAGQVLGPPLERWHAELPLGEGQEGFSESRAFAMPS